MFSFVAIKLGCTRIFDVEGNLIPVTLLKVQDTTLLGKYSEGDYSRLRLGYVSVPEAKLTKANAGQFKVLSGEGRKMIREYSVSALPEGDLGAGLYFQDYFSPGMFVDATATSKGKGFSGVIKRHGFSRGPETHGSRHHRKPGSSGFLDLTRVMKGKPYPGRKGGERVTVQNLKLLHYDIAESIAYLKGSVPGPKKSFVWLKKAVKKNV